MVMFSRRFFSDSLTGCIDPGLLLATFRRFDIALAQIRAGL
jgi:hypothetical protein